jgi:tetratricopeptide (TPR) repeat protein
MRLLTVLIAIMIFVTGCATKTVIIKSHPVDEAPQTAKDSKVIVSDNHMEQGKKLYFKGKFTQATKHFIRSIANNRENWEAYYYLGLTQQKRERFDRSIGSFNNSLKFAPHDNILRAKIHYALGVSWEHEGYFTKANEKFKLALSLYPGYKQAGVAMKRVKTKTLQAESRKKAKKKGDKAF